MIEGTFQTDGPLWYWLTQVGKHADLKMDETGENVTVMIVSATENSGGVELSIIGREPDAGG